MFLLEDDNGEQVELIKKTMFKNVTQAILQIWLSSDAPTRTKSSLSKSMQPSMPPIGQRWTFSTSQVDLTHNDDYVVTIVDIINFTTIVFTSMQ